MNSCKVDDIPNFSCSSTQFFKKIWIIAREVEETNVRCKINLKIWMKSCWIRGVVDEENLERENRLEEEMKKRKYENILEISRLILGDICTLIFQFPITFHLSL